MIRSDPSSLPDALAQGNTPSNWSCSMNEPDTISSSLDHTKRKRNDSFGSQTSSNEATRALSVDNATATQNLLAEYLQNAEQQQGIDRRPGRKPLHQKQPDDEEDPKVKRKVQNRAAQRAFRERKERYVRELELKIQHIQASHMQTTSQLTQENQYLRFVIHRLKSELSTVKGIPVESIPDLIPALDEWQQQQQQQQQHAARLPPTPNAAGSDLAPFLTMGSQPIHAAPTPIAPAPPRSRPLAPAGPAPIAPRPNHATTSSSLKRPVAILPQSSNNNNNNNHHQHPHQHHQPSITTTNNNTNQQATTSYVQNARLPSPPEASASNSSTAALYVRFSPQESAGDQFGDDYLTTSPVYERQNLFNTNASGSSAGGSHHSRSPPYMGSAEGSTSKEDVGEKAVAVDEVESEATRIQTVWRRLNLYGRFTDFSFDQLCRVAQMADGNPAMQRTMGNDASVEPSMEDWELDKLMHQIDPDHL